MEKKPTNITESTYDELWSKWAKKVLALKEEDFFEAEIKNGVDVLDEYDPDWIFVINDKALDMEMPNLCIIGQLFDGSYSTGLRSLEYALSGGLEDEAGAYGFDWNVEATERVNEWCIEKGVDYDEDVFWVFLREEWIKVLRDKRERAESELKAGQR